MRVRGIPSHVESILDNVVPHDFHVAFGSVPGQYRTVEEEGLMLAGRQCRFVGEETINSNTSADLADVVLDKLPGLEAPCCLLKGDMG